MLCEIQHAIFFYVIFVWTDFLFEKIDLRRGDMLIKSCVRSASVSVGHPPNLSEKRKKVM